MRHHNALVIEAKIPSAAPITADQLERGISFQQQRERESLHDWLEAQEEAEIEFYLGSFRRSPRFDLDSAEY